MRDLNSFVDAIRQEGIEAGRQAAARLESEGEVKAAQIVQEAEARAERIIAAAEAERKKTLARTRSDLSLAARDTLIRLRDAMGAALTDILLRETRGVLADPAFLAGLIRDIVRQYTQADAAGNRVVCVTVSDSARTQLAQWGMAKLSDSTAKDGVSLELRGGLLSAGLEYRIDRGTVEITPEAVVSVLSEFISAELAPLVSGESEHKAGE
jgi:V/A-type H+-transporting ATPase subunit E